MMINYWNFYNVMCLFYTRTFIIKHIYNYTKLTTHSLCNIYDVFKYFMRLQNKSLLII